MLIYLRRQYRNGRSNVDSTLVWDQDLFWASRAADCAATRALPKGEQSSTDVISVHPIPAEEYRKEKGYKVLT